VLRTPPAFVLSQDQTRHTFYVELCKLKVLALPLRSRDVSQVARPAENRFPDLDLWPCKSLFLLTTLQLSRCIFIRPFSDGVGKYTMLQK
jgi:hypothetical protein